MEHPGIIPWLAVLSAPAAFLVSGSVLPGSPSSGRAWNVPARLSLDGKPTRCLGGGAGICLQRVHLELFDVASLHGVACVDAVRGVDGGARMAPGRQVCDWRRGHRSLADAGRTA